MISESTFGKKFNTLVLEAQLIRGTYEENIEHSETVYKLLQSTKNDVKSKTPTPFLVDSIVELLSGLVSPFGGNSDHYSSANSSGKKFIELLLVIALYKTINCVVPEVRKCDGTPPRWYRIHTSTHSLHQPSQVDANNYKKDIRFIYYSGHSGRRGTAG